MEHGHLVFILLGVLLLWSFICSSAETALFSLTKTYIQKIKRSDHIGHNIYRFLFHDPRRLLISILIGNEVANVSSTVIATSLLISFFGYRYERWMPIAIMTPILLLFCEFTPKSLAIRFSKTFVFFEGPIIFLWAKIVAPVRLILLSITNIVLWGFRLPRYEVHKPLTEEEFKDIVDVGAREGVIEQEERDLIHKVFKFTDTPLTNILTKKEKVFSLPDNIGLDEVASTFKKNKWSRIPIYRKDKDNIIGLLYLKDLMQCLEAGKFVTGKKAGDIIRPVQFVPYNKKVDELLREFQRQHTHFAVVVNEYGKMIGIITMEDLLEEIFGEFKEEHERKTP